MRQIWAEFDLYNNLTLRLLKSTGEVFGKALIGLWVNFGRYLVPGKQWVDASENWAKIRPKMLNFNISLSDFVSRLKIMCIFAKY